MRKIRVKHKGDRGELLFYSAIVALPILQVLIFYFYVNFNSILLCFKEYEVKGGASKWVGFDNFKRLWTEFTKTSILIDAFKNSILVWIFVSLFGTFLSILFSYYIFKKWFAAKMFKFVLFLPSVLPAILFVSLYKFFVDQAIPGYMDEVFNKTVNPLFMGNTYRPTLLFFNVWICFGAQVLIYSGAMGQVPPEILEAGKVDGVSCTQEFFKIVFPMILPTVSTFLIANVATIFTNQANLYALFGDSSKVSYEHFTIGYYLFDLVNLSGNGESMYGYASALGVVCTLIAFPLTIGVRKLLSRGEE